MQEPTLQMSDLVEMASDVVRACEHLEATKFVHRDIAARNCLLTTKISTENARRVVKIADFGMARDIYRHVFSGFISQPTYLKKFQKRLLSKGRQSVPSGSMDASRGKTLIGTSYVIAKVEPKKPLLGLGAKTRHIKSLSLYLAPSNSSFALMRVLAIL